MTGAASLGGVRNPGADDGSASGVLGTGTCGTASTFLVGSRQAACEAAGRLLRTVLESWSFLTNSAADMRPVAVVVALARSLRTIESIDRRVVT